MNDEMDKAIADMNKRKAIKKQQALLLAEK
jgi:hypothetical protein